MFQSWLSYWIKWQGWKYVIFLIIIIQGKSVGTVRRLSLSLGCLFTVYLGDCLFPWDVCLLFTWETVSFPELFVYCLPGRLSLSLGYLFTVYLGRRLSLSLGCLG